MRYATFILGALSTWACCGCGARGAQGKASQTEGSSGGAGQSAGSGGADNHAGAGAPTGTTGGATTFATLPYRGVSLAGAEFAATIGATFDGNTLGKIPDNYYYPDKDWVDEDNYPGGYGKNAFPFYRHTGMNVFRLPFRWERLQHTLNGDFDPTEFADLKQTVADMEASGAFVLLDVHNYIHYASQMQIKSGTNGDTVGSAKVPYSAFADLWRRLAEQYKDDKNVLFGLMNEPMGIDDLNQWLNAANAAIAAIRGTGAKNLILVGGNEYEDAGRWPQVSDMLKDVKDPANNFSFEVHVYPDSDQTGSGDSCPDTTAGSKQLQPFTDWARAHKAKGFLGEFSAGTSINAQANCIAALDDEISHLEKNSDVYIGWTYWAGGQGFGADNPMEWSVRNKKNSKQMDLLVKHLK